VFCELPEIGDEVDLDGESCQQRLAAELLREQLSTLSHAPLPRILSVPAGYSSRTQRLGVAPSRQLSCSSLLSHQHFGAGVFGIWLDHTDEFGAIESVKAASQLFAPVSGVVSAGILARFQSSFFGSQNVRKQNVRKQRPTDLVLRRFNLFGGVQRYSPQILEVNEALTDDPGLLNSNPEDSGVSPNPSCPNCISH
jgi:hypothetical protein